MFWPSGVNAMKLTFQRLFYLYWFSVVFKIYSTSWCSICLFKVFKFIHFSSPISRSILCLYYKITLSSKFFLFFSNWCSSFHLLLLCILFVFLFEGFLHLLLLWKTGGRFIVDFFFYASSSYLSVSFSSYSNVYYMCRPRHSNSILLLPIATLCSAVLNKKPI